jgi:hypothetical protein
MNKLSVVFILSLVAVPAHGMLSMAKAATNQATNKSLAQVLVRHCSVEPLKVEEKKEENKALQEECIKEIARLNKEKKDFLAIINAGICFMFVGMLFNHNAIPLASLIFLPSVVGFASNENKIVSYELRIQNLKAQEELNNKFALMQEALDKLSK